LEQGISEPGQRRQSDENICELMQIDEQNEKTDGPWNPSPRLMSGPLCFLSLLKTQPHGGAEGSDKHHQANPFVPILQIAQLSKFIQDKIAHGRSLSPCSDAAFIGHEDFPANRSVLWQPVLRTP
jgi:hypothetical protein